MIEDFERHLQMLVQEREGPYADLFKAARYSLFSKGKRLRPLLLLTTVEVLKGNLERALQPACALEMIHTYSLIHDDLPCMDNDDFRRGKPTLHKVFPEWQALLAGDFLLTYAFEVIATSPGLHAEEKLKLVHLFSSKAGGEGMVAGQVIDLLGSALTVEHLQEMHHLKTGMLVQAALEAGALLATKEERVASELKQFGQKIGLAFQIIDDVLDAAEEEVNYATLLGPEKAKASALTLLESAKEHLRTLQLHQSKLSLLADKLVLREI